MLERRQKKIILVLNDLSLLAFSLWLSVSIYRKQPLTPADWDGGWTFIVVPIFGAAIYQYFGSYKQVTRFFSKFGIYQICKATGFAVLLLTIFVQVAGAKSFPYEVLIYFGLFAGTLLVLSRQLAGYVLSQFASDSPSIEVSKIPVMIYGVGLTGMQLSEGLAKDGHYKVVGFIDSSKELWRQRIGGLKVFPPDQISDVLKRESVQEIFLADAELNFSERRSIIQSLMSNEVTVKTLPALSDLASGKVQYSDLRSIRLEDLLGREPVRPIPELLQKSITGKIVLVTGAGGSIGSELVRQIYQRDPKKLILLEQSEASLYVINSELEELQKNKHKSQPEKKSISIKTVLGSVLDQGLMDKLLGDDHVSTIFHAAAYKHVPLVEQNPIVGVQNNTFGTKIVADMAVKHAVDKMILISTDKAVRPTNVMGASKRLAEIILQAYAENSGSSTTFAMVRFGNVLGSSGSVVPKFREQIKNGGPVTVTHREIERYFMSISEAVQLVIQTAALAQNGGVYVLDMGEPVRIEFLARMMIEMSGLTVLDSNNPEGDISIEYTGLRPGEKIKEELLIDGMVQGTEHPRILRNLEVPVPVVNLMKQIDMLNNACETGNKRQMVEAIGKLVEGYQNREFVDVSKPAFGDSGGRSSLDFVH